jgi:hypothetical protein
VRRAIVLRMVYSPCRCFRALENEYSKQAADRVD